MRTFLGKGGWPGLALARTKAQMVKVVGAGVNGHTLLPVLLFLHESLFLFFQSFIDKVERDRGLDAGYIRICLLT